MQSVPDPGARRANRWLAGMGFFAIALAFAPVWSGAQSFYHLDTYFEHVPFWRFAADSFARGEWPGWTPNIRAGYPLHANGEASLLYPIAALLRMGLPDHRAVDFFVLLHLLALAGFTWRYLREIDVSPRLAAFGAVAFALSGRMVASAIWPNAVAVSAFLPLVLLGIEQSRRERLRPALVIAAAIGLGLLAGRPQRLVPMLLFAGAYAAFTGVSVARTRGLGEGIGSAGACAIGALLGFAIGAPQALPTLLLVADSIWADGVSRTVFEANSLAARPLRSVLATALLPAGGATLPEGRLYPGLLIFVGVGLGLWRAARPRSQRRDPRAAFLLIAGFACLWIASAGPLTFEISQALPVLSSLRAPTRFGFPAAFALSVFAVLALRELETRATSRWLGGVLGVAVAELVVVTWLVAPTAPATIYAIRPRVYDRFELERDPVGFDYRFYASGQWVAPGLVDRLEPALLREQFASLTPTRDLPMRFGGLSASGYGEPKLAWKHRSYQRLAPSELDQLGVRRLFMSHRLRDERYEPEAKVGAAFVYTNPGALPRALCVASVAAATDFDDALDRAATRSFDPRDTAWVETGHLATEGRGGPCQVRRVGTKPTLVAVETRAEAPTWLVLFDTWAPGWTATIDGAATPVWRVNGMFRLVEIPAGHSLVRFEYIAPGLTLGSWVGGPAAVGWLGAWILSVRRRRAAG